MSTFVHLELTTGFFIFFFPKKADAQTLGIDSTSRLMEPFSSSQSSFTIGVAFPPCDNESEGYNDLPV